MKPIKDLKEKKTIDDEKTHNRILCEMGVLDDLEDWTLYQEQERRFYKLYDEIPDEIYKKYMGR